MLVLNKNIGELVDEHFILARALNHLGIDFLTNTNKTLIQVCKERKLHLKTVLTTFDSFNEVHGVGKDQLQTYPIDLVIAYLKHSHYIFIKDRLPYILKLVNKLDQEQFHMKSIIDDLKLIFPVFLEDFIKHIYEEEDTVFKYIARLNDVVKGTDLNTSKILYQFRKYSITKVALEHQEEDELEGLRDMLKTLEACPSRNLHLNTIIKELKCFDAEMENHAHIENDILFPLAIELEKEVWSIQKRLVQLN